MCIWNTVGLIEVIWIFSWCWSCKVSSFIAYKYVIRSQFWRTCLSRLKDRIISWIIMSSCEKNVPKTFWLAHTSCIPHQLFHYFYLGNSAVVSTQLKYSNSNKSSKLTYLEKASCQSELDVRFPLPIKYHLYWVIFLFAWDLYRSWTVTRQWRHTIN